MLDLADAVVMHDPVRLDDHRPVVPAIAHEQLPTRPLDRGVELPGIRRVDGERLLAHHVRTGLQRRLGLLEVMAGRAAHDHDVRPGRDDLVPVVGRPLEAEVVLDALEQLGVAPVDDGELHLARIAASDEVGQMRADGP